jgi:hypothetical protein
MMKLDAHTLSCIASLIESYETVTAGSLYLGSVDVFDSDNIPDKPIGKLEYDDTDNIVFVAYEDVEVP